MNKKLDFLSLKLRSRKGQYVFKKLTKDHNVCNLKTYLAEICKIAPKDLHVMSGFPPKPLDLSNNCATLESIGLHTGDTLIVEEKKNQVLMRNPSQNDDNKEYGPRENPFNKGVLMRKIVPADNSCLFSSIIFCLKGRSEPSSVPYMRQLVAKHVSEDKETYSEAMLGNSNDIYCKWIVKPDSWGGAIELSILSGYFGIEMVVIDTVNAIVNRFGEDKDYPERIFLIFDGIHYDPLYMELYNKKIVQTIFSTEDDYLFQEAHILALEAYSSRKYTDENKFSLKCLECQMVMKGQVQAADHAKTSGHNDFGEVWRT